MKIYLFSIDNRGGAMSSHAQVEAIQGQKLDFPSLACKLYVRLNPILLKLYNVQQFISIQTNISFQNETTWSFIYFN